LDDSFALCMARQQSLTSLLTLMGAYREELEYIVLSNLINVIFTSTYIFHLNLFQYFISPDQDPFSSQISSKVGRIAADATPDLKDDINQFFINLFQFSAE